MFQISQGVDEDPRLKVFNKEWFQGKDCLDIGCNSGIITIQIGIFLSFFLKYLFNSINNYCVNVILTMSNFHASLALILALVVVVVVIV